MLEIMKNKWMWMFFFAVAVLIYLVLDLADAAMMLTQVLVLPMTFLLMILPAGDVLSGVADMLDVDVGGLGPVFLRVCSFAIRLASVCVPIYLCVKSGKKAYLAWVGVAVVWVIVALCFYGWVWVSMWGMMD